MNNVITFDPEAHIYYCDGKPVPSVTQILTDSKVSDYGAMDKKFRDYAILRGRMVHKATELFDTDTLDEASVDPQIAGYFKAYKKFREDLPWVPVCIEKVVYNPKLKYAGTLDRVFSIPDGREVLLDIKTGESVPTWLDLQLSAYVEALKHDVTGVNEAVGLSLHKDGTYSLTSVFTAKRLKEQFTIFKSAIVMAKYNGRKKV
jgi:hypothetical protein